MKDHIEAARQHHARTGAWPPDPLLDEVAEMRRRVAARSDGGYGMVPDWYREPGERSPSGNPREGAADEPSAGVGRR